jgi:hypothetical protein
MVTRMAKIRAIAFILNGIVAALLGAAALAGTAPAAVAAGTTATANTDATWGH